MRIKVGTRRLFPLAAILLVQTLAQAAQLHPCGLIREDPRTIPWMIQDSLVPYTPRRLGVSVDLSSQMPPVGNQGTQGSCAAWAIGYYQKTHYEWREHHWNDSVTSHQYSPAFIYNQINGGADQGSGTSEAFALITDQGCGTMADCPYSQSDYTTWPSESAEHLKSSLTRWLRVRNLWGELLEDRVASDAAYGSRRNTERLLAHGRLWRRLPLVSFFPEIWRRGSTGRKVPHCLALGLDRRGWIARRHGPRRRALRRSRRHRLKTGGIRGQRNS